MKKWKRSKLEELQSLKKDFREAFKEMEKYKILSKGSRDERDAINNTLNLKKQEILLAVKEDGTPLLDGKNQTIRDAQMQTHLKDINYELKEQEQSLARNEFELQLVYDRISLLRNLSRLVRAEVELVTSSEKDEMEG